MRITAEPARDTGAGTPAGHDPAPADASVEEKVEKLGEQEKTPG